MLRATFSSPCMRSFSKALGLGRLQVGRHVVEVVDELAHLVPAGDGDLNAEVALPHQPGARR